MVVVDQGAAVAGPGLPHLLRVLLLMVEITVVVQLGVLEHTAPVEVVEQTPQAAPVVDQMPALVVRVSNLILMVITIIGAAAALVLPIRPFQGGMEVWAAVVEAHHPTLDMEEPVGQQQSTAVKMEMLTDLVMVVMAALTLAAAEGEQATFQTGTAETVVLA